jgi:CBS domain-containing protein
VESRTDKRRHCFVAWPLVGMITDRDIAIRGVAEGKGPDAKVRDAMSPEVKYCFEDEDVTHVAENMAELQVRRLPVMNRDKRLVVAKRGFPVRKPWPR